MLALPILRNPRDRSHPDVVRSAWRSGRRL